MPKSDGVPAIEHTKTTSVTASADNEGDGHNTSDRSDEESIVAQEEEDSEGDESSDDNIDADAVDWYESEDDEAAHSLIGGLSDQMDCEDGPPENVDEIHDLIRSLWFGKHFQMNTVDAVARGHARLASVLAEVRWIRDSFNSGGNLVGDRRLTTKEVTDIYNKYRDDMSWMPRNVWSQYEAEAKGKGKGKNKGSKKPVSFSQQAHQLRRTRFSEYCFKRFGSKALFFHFVKIGTRNIQIPELLQQWSAFKKSDEYKKLKECNAAKSAEELELKNKRDRLRFALFDKRKRGAAEAELDEALALYEEAQALYVATGRAGRRRGVAQSFK